MRFPFPAPRVLVTCSVLRVAQLSAFGGAKRSAVSHMLPTCSHERFIIYMGIRLQFHQLYFQNNIDFQTKPRTRYGCCPAASAASAALAASSRRQSRGRERGGQVGRIGRRQRLWFGSKKKQYNKNNTTTKQNIDDDKQRNQHICGLAVGCRLGEAGSSALLRSIQIA